MMFSLFFPKLPQLLSDCLLQRNRPPPDTSIPHLAVVISVDMCRGRLIAAVVHQHCGFLIQWNALTVAVLLCLAPPFRRNDAPQWAVVVHCRH